MMLISTTSAQVITLAMMAMAYVFGYLVRDLFEAGKSFDFPEPERPNLSSGRDIIGNKHIGDA